MKILYLCDEYPPGQHGGIGTAVQALARSVVKLGHTVIVAGFYDWGYGGQEKYEDEGVIVYRYRRSLDSRYVNYRNGGLAKVIHKILKGAGILEWDIRRSMAGYSKFLEDIIRTHNIEIAEVPDYHDYMRYCSRPVYFPKLSVPTVLKLHGSLLYLAEHSGHKSRQAVGLMERQLLKQVNAVVSVSKYTAGEYARIFAYNKPIEVIYNGISIERHSGPINRKLENQVIFTGSLVESKGIFALLAAWKTVIKEIPEARLHVLGKGDIAKAKNVLAEEVRDTVLFFGHVDKVTLYNELSASAVAVFPSYSETLGLAAIEAMLNGCAVIFTERTAGPEVISDEETGLLVDPTNAQQIAQKTIRLLQDRPFRDKLARNAIHEVNEKFDIKKTSEQHVNYYLSILARPKQPKL